MLIAVQIVSIRIQSISLLHQGVRITALWPLGYNG